MNPTLALLALLALTGCSTARAPALRPAVVSAPVVASQEGKDRTVLSEALKIETLAPQTKPHTDAQRQAVAAAPAADVSRLVNAYEAQIKDLNDRVAGLSKTIENLKDVELKRQAAWLRGFGFGAFAVAGLLVWARQFEFSATAALAGIALLGLAQLISQPWFMPAVGIAAGLALAAVGYIGYRKYRKDTLARSIAVDAERMKSALTTIVPAVDSALAALDSAAQSVVKSALSRAMDSDHKALVKEIKASF
jgi:hypothetical protein